MAVGFDVATSGNNTYTGSNSTGHTISHTCTAASLIIAFVEESVDGTNVTTSYPTSVKYAGVDLTAVGTSVQATSTSARLWLYKLLSPASGANNLVVVSPSNAFHVTMITTISFTGSTCDVRNYNSTTSNGATNSPSLAITTTSGNIAIAGGAHGDTITGIGSAWGTQRSLLNVTGTSAGGNCITGSAVAAGASVTASFTSSVNDTWLMCGAEVYESGGAAAVSQSSRRRPSRLLTYR